MSQIWTVGEIVPGSTAPATDITKLTDALASLKSNFIGTSLPVTNLVAGMFAIDTADDLYVRNSANDGWVLIGNIESVRLGAAALAGSASQVFSASTLSAATTIGVGAATPAASGAGITFPATQSASSDANTLDDYEEGIWTPSPVNLTVVGTPTYTGTYTKIGRKVSGFLMVDSTVSTAATADTTRFSGLPFAASSIGGMALSVVTNTTASTAAGQIGASGTQIVTGGWPASANVRVAFWYEV